MFVCVSGRTENSCYISVIGGERDLMLLLLVWRREIVGGGGGVGGWALC